MDIKELKKEIWKAYNERSVWTQKSDVDKFKKLLDELDEPKKVYIPQFVADWIENDLDYVGKEPINIVHGVVEDGDCGPRGEWLDDIENQKLLLNAIANGYEVEKPRRVVKLKGIHGLRKYVRLDDEGKVILGLAGSDGITGGALTEDEAKEKWPEFELYHNAGLLEFEEVEDDD
ncbi:DUF1642 domain-containing protein [Pediococcus acidilactici]|uniref:DUF1642 domain-containing protein n=1 Tax=Pediococcus acidilactici TaxID=1254 RepID=UPI00137BFC95|nr:DUF1642 domain-containing protein [Pediococcus acidilactici]QHS03570.1 DUF1642 domain-containing protein [Pediococcus acidilactici]